MRKSKKIIAAFAGITGTVVLTVGFVSQAVEAKQAFQILSPTPIYMAEAVPWEAWKELNESVKQAKLQYEEQKRIEAEKKAAEEARIAAEQEEAVRVAAEQEEAARVAAEQEEADRVAAEQEAAAQIAAEQEASAQAEAASASAGNGNISAEQELLAALIFCEAGNQPYEGQVAVGAVVMNRVRSGAYPDSIAEVIYQSGQFTPAMTGWLDTVLAEGSYTDSAMQAAADALSGSSPVGDLLYFDCGGYGYQIGDHYFH